VGKYEVEIGDGLEEATESLREELKRRFDV
jgi:hypothetical protein